MVNRVKVTSEIVLCVCGCLMTMNEVDEVVDGRDNISRLSILQETKTRCQIRIKKEVFFFAERQLSGVFDVLRSFLL